MEEPGEYDDEERLYQEELEREPGEYGGEERRYREELEREYVRLKVELAQVQSDTERHKLMSTQLSSETDQLRSAVAQSKNSEREMRELAKKLGDEVSKLQREVKTKEAERDQVKAEAERTQEQTAQLEKTLEVLGGRKVTELLNARRKQSHGMSNDQERGLADGRAIGATGSDRNVQVGRRRSPVEHIASGSESFRSVVADNANSSQASLGQSVRGRASSGATGDGAIGSSVTGGSPGNATSFRSLGQSVRSLASGRMSFTSSNRPSVLSPDAFLFDQRRGNSERGDQDASGGNEGNDRRPAATVSSRTISSTDSRRRTFGESAGSLRMSVKDFMRGLDKEC